MSDERDVSARAAAPAKCPHCGAADVIRGIRAGAGTDGPIGLQYYGVIFAAAEPLLADLCRACGTVTRLWVRRLDREWSTTRS